MHTKVRSLFTILSLVSLLMVLFSPGLRAEPRSIDGHWYQPTSAHWQYQQQAVLDKAGLLPLDAIPVTGGEFWFEGTIVVSRSGQYVLDFQNATAIGRFQHYLFDGNKLVNTQQGGIQSEVANPFFLRHGRMVELPAGEYRLITHLSSPFFIAQPAPFITELGDYQTAIKGANTLATVGLGLFLGLGLYYAALSLYRRRRTELMYALFIFGNVLMNSTSLLVLPDVFNIHWYYLISVPMLFSNAAYILFVMALLEISPARNPRLHRAGMVSLVLIAILAIGAALFPHWSLEMARYGVGIFLLYGLSSGIARAYQKSVTAKLYLLAIALFFIFGGSTIINTTLPGVYTYTIEHLGLFAVMLEVLLLSFVISYQFRQLQEETELLSTEVGVEKNRGDALARAITEAERANRAKTEFLSNMSHELRTPMNSILGFSELLLEEESLAERHQNDVRRIHKAGSHLLRLINDVLDLAKIEAGHLHISIEQVDLNEVIEESLNLINPLATHRQISLHCQHRCSRPIAADHIRLKQVLLNLLSNAIKYNHPGGEVRIEIQQPNDDIVRLSVVDTGKGIAADQMEALFEPFNRLSEECGEIEGTGIGLTLSRSIIEQMHGTIGVDSTPGEGSRFWLQLPVSHAEQTPKPNEMATPTMPARSPTGNRKTVLLYVDDNPMNLLFVERALESQPQIELITAHEPLLGLELAGSHRPGIIMLDINMPHLNGYQVLERIRQNPELKDTPVFAVTADAVSSGIGDGQPAGFDEFLIKPIELISFIQLVRKYLPAT